jgi:hypothetical protein
MGGHTCTHTRLDRLERARRSSNPWKETYFA